MKGAAICKLDKRLFAVFAILLDKTKLITSPDKLEELLNASTDRIHHQSTASHHIWHSPVMATGRAANHLWLVFLLAHQTPARSQDQRG
jgi:hypothetical protein